MNITPFFQDFIKGFCEVFNWYSKGLDRNINEYKQPNPRSHKNELDQSQEKIQRYLLKIAKEYNIVK